MKVKLEYEYDPKYELTPYFVRVGEDKFFSGVSFEDAKANAIKYFAATKLIVVPPPEEIDIGGDGDS